MNNRRRLYMEYQLSTKLQAETIIQHNRILGAGAISSVRKLDDFFVCIKDLGLLSTTGLAFNTNFGVKIDGSNASSVFYDVMHDGSYDGVQATGASQPIYSAGGGYGGESGLTFDGANDFFTLKNTYTLTGQNLTIVAKVKSVLANSDGGTILAGANGRPHFTIARGSNVLVLNKADQVNIGVSSAISSDHTVVAVSYNAAGVYDFYENGTLIGTGTNDQTLSAGISTIGKKITTEYLKGVLSSAYYFNSKLTQSQIQTIGSL